MWIDVVLRDERLALFETALGRAIPCTIGDLADGTKIDLGLAVALKAPAHRERLGLIDDFHLVDATVATHAANAAIDVGAVIEVRKVRKLVNALPLDRKTRRRALLDFH